MSEETFGPAGRPRRSDDFEVRREEFAEKLNLQLEPKAEPEFIPPEPPWDADRKSWWTGYLKRNPQARSKPRELTKFETTKIAPGVSIADYLPGLLDKLRTALENYALFEEKLAAFEAKVNANPCAEYGPNFRLVDQECIELDSHFASQPSPENSAAKAAESATVDRIMDKVVSKGRFFRKQISLDGGWTILSGKGT